MNITDLRNYFEKYVSAFQPYKNIPEYKILINTLLEYYVNDSYNNINSPFKSAFEKQELPVEFYDNLLLSIGYPKELISKFSLSDKEVLLKSFMDYNKYKGTIEQVRLIGSEFKEPIGVYELFIDFRKININYYEYHLVNGLDRFVTYDHAAWDLIEEYDLFTVDGLEYVVTSKFYDIDNVEFYLNLDKVYNGETQIIQDFTIQRWVFIPNPIYIANDIEQKVEYFNYNEIYLKTNKFFISLDNLMNEYAHNNLLLPIKSNLLFLDYNKYREVSTIYNLFSTIFLKDFYNERLVIYFKDGNYSTSLGKLYRLWHYIIMKHHNFDFNHVSNISVLFDPESSGFTYTIDDIPTIEQEYSEIETTNDYSLFYYNYISSKLEPEIFVDKTYTFNQYELILKNNIGVDLIDYIDDRINNITTDSEGYEYNTILTEIYNSIITWSVLTDNSQIKDNIHYFLNNLSTINFPIDLSPSYNLLLFYKPYHVELIAEMSESLRVTDTGDSAILDFKKTLFLYLTRSSSLENSEFLLNHIKYKFQDGYTVLSNNSNYYVNYFKELLYTIEYLSKFYLKSEYETTNQPISTKHLNTVLLNIKANIYAISKSVLEVSLNKKEILDILHTINVTVFNYIKEIYTDVIETSNFSINQDEQYDGVFVILDILKIVTYKYLNYIKFDHFNEYELQFEQDEDVLNVLSKIQRFELEINKFRDIIGTYVEVSQVVIPKIKESIEFDYFNEYDLQFEQDEQILNVLSEVQQFKLDINKFKDTVESYDETHPIVIPKIEEKLVDFKYSKTFDLEVDKELVLDVLHNINNAIVEFNNNKDIVKLIHELHSIITLKHKMNNNITDHLFNFDITESIESIIDTLSKINFVLVSFKSDSSVVDFIYELSGIVNHYNAHDVNIESSKQFQINEDSTNIVDVNSSRFDNIDISYNLKNHIISVAEEISNIIDYHTNETIKSVSNKRNLYLNNIFENSLFINIMYNEYLQFKDSSSLICFSDERRITPILNRFNYISILNNSIYKYLYYSASISIDITNTNYSNIRMFDDTGSANINDIESLILNLPIKNDNLLLEHSYSFEEI